MKNYDIEVEEILRRVINVEAKNINEAISIVNEKVDNGEIELYADDYCERDIRNLYSKRLTEPLKIELNYNAETEILTIKHNDSKEVKYVCETVQNIVACIQTHLVDYVENSEIEEDKYQLEDELER